MIFTDDDKMTPPLLRLLVKTLADEKLFAKHDDTEYPEYVKAWLAVYETAAVCWLDAFAFGSNEGDAMPDPFGPEIFKRTSPRHGAALPVL